MAVAMAYRGAPGQRRMSSRTPSRLLAVLALVGTYLIFQLLFNPDKHASPEEVADDGSYANFLSQKARSLASSLDFSKHIHGRLAAVEERSLEEQQAILARPAATPPTEEELSARANVRIHAPHEAVRLCPDCDCLVAGAYASSPAFAVPVAKLDLLRERIRSSGSFHTRSVLRYLMHHIPLSSSLDGLFLKDSTIADSLILQFTCPDSLISFNFTGLALDKPTQYLYTRTGPAGRLKTWEQRRPYMDRQVNTLHDFQKLVQADGYEGGVPADARQLMWIVVEDDVSMEPGLERLLRESGIRMSTHVEMASNTD